MLASMAEMVLTAKKAGYAVGQFNFSNLELAQAALEAAEELRAPLILGVTEGGLRHMGVEFAAAIGLTAARQAKVPVSLHLDHAGSFDLIMSCIKAGFNSVMFDGSRLPIEENIRMTKEICRVAHAMGVSVEAEVGAIGGVEDDLSVAAADALVADPEEAVNFWQQTKVDALAVAVGNAHGMYKTIPNIRTDIVQAVAGAIPVPVVLHGGSGTPDDIIRRAIAAGCAKINVSTENQVAFTSTLRRLLTEDPELADSRKCLGPARAVVKGSIKERITVFGAAGKAVVG